MSFEQDAPKAVSASAHNLPISVYTLKKRSDFLRIGKEGKRFACPLFSVTMLAAPDERIDVQVGYTVSKKVSKKAVVRNRIKRRLKEAVRLDFPVLAKPGNDYVIIARQASENVEFVQLRESLRFALKWLHKNSEKYDG